jgi:hypothetical protein
MSIDIHIIYVRRLINEFIFNLKQIIFWNVGSTSQFTLYFLYVEHCLWHWTRSDGLAYGLSALDVDIPRLDHIRQIKFYLHACLSL